MTTPKCHLAVNMATGDVFSEAEIDSMMERLAERAKKARKAEPTISETEAIAEAARALTRDELFAQLQAQRVKTMSKAKAAVRAGQLAGMPEKMTESQKLSALNVGSETQGKSTSTSVDAEGRARSATALGEVERGLAQVPGLRDRITNSWGISEKGMDEKVALEMARLNGDGSVQPTGDEGALHAARVFAQALERSRQALNATGAWVGKRAGYIVRQSHDPAKIAAGFWREMSELGARAKAGEGFDIRAAQIEAGKRAFRTWRDVQMKLLKPETFEGLDLEDVPFWKWEDEADEARAKKRAGKLEDAAMLAGKGVMDNPDSLEERMLYYVWMDIVTGRMDELGGAVDAGEFRPPPSKAAQVSKSRTFLYTPENWVEYNRQFGRGSVFAAVIGQLDRNAKNAALMNTWGPNPANAWAHEREAAIKRATAEGDIAAVKRLKGARQTAEFDTVNGGMAPESLRLALVGSTIRSWEAVTKLGGMVLSMVTDMPITGHVFARAGAGFFSGYEAYLRGVLRLQSAEAKEAADLLDVAARAFGMHITGAFRMGDGVAGWNAWSQQTFYKLNLAEFIIGGHRRGVAEMFARHLGQEAARPWAGLNIGTRETFERFGISEALWEKVRHGLEPAGDGRTYWTMDQIERANLTPAERSEAQLRFRTMIHNFIDDATSEPRARERALLAFGTKPGTKLGEAVRVLAQFKSFPAAVLGRHLAPAMKGYAGYKPAALMAHFIVSTALFGYLAMNAKLISRGQAPRSMAGADAGETAKIWAAAMVQGGGLGIYGDFLFGEHNRNGQGFALSSLAGPALGDIEKVAQVVLSAVRGGEVSESTGKSRLPAELVKLGSRNLPLINTFYTRLALDYLVLWRMQEAVSPGYLQRYENRVRTQEHGEFLLPPTSAIQ